MALVPELLVEVAMAIAIGGLVGIEREHTEEKKYAGLRTLSLLAGAAPGAVAVSQKAGTPIFVGIYLALVAALSLAIIAVRFRVEGEEIGFTTSVAVFTVGILGILVGYNLYSEATSLAIILTLVLAEKKTLHGYVDMLSKEEISRAVQRAALAFILLPILPSKPTGPFNAVVPQEVLLLAIFVLLIEFAAYISMRKLDTPGIYLTGILGGVASSFATTAVMTRLSLKEDVMDGAAAAANLSAISMTARNIVIAAALLPAAWASKEVISTLYVPALFMVLPLAGAAYYLRGNEEEIDEELESPFSLKSGMKFAAIFVAVSVSSVIGKQVAGTAGVYATALLGGTVSSAAVATSAATSLGSLGAETVSGMILLSIMGSLLSKMVIVEFTNQELRRKVSLPMLTSILLGLAAILLI